MDMASTWSANGVTRFLHVLTESLSHDSSYAVTWVRFIHQLTDEKIVENRLGYRQIIIPLPSDLRQFLRNQELRMQIWNVAFREIESVLMGDETCILHVHTLNLMEFALYVKKRYPCKIISHVHCLSWKSLYNNHSDRFNQLYEQYYIRHDTNRLSEFISSKYEWQTYMLSDGLVCVTNCARDFIRGVCPNSLSNIQVITNGINDIGVAHDYKIKGNSVQCLFVGNSTRSKGLEYILQALHIVNMQYNVTLKVAGTYSSANRDSLRNKYPFLDIQFTGKLPMSRLNRLYTHSDIGIIASLQEQCSYVAIEMMMFGLPIITTDVDGLGELFEHRKNALTVPTQFHPTRGLSIDTVQMADSIIALIEDESLREKIGRNARKSFLFRHTKEKMVSKLKHIYNTI